MVKPENKPKQTKTTPVKVVKDVKKVKESKTDYFIRIAEPRVMNVLKTLRVLGNCANRNSYEYSKEQTDKIFEKFHLALEILQNKFTASKKEQESFKF